MLVELDDDVPVVGFDDGAEAVLGLGNPVTFGVRSHWMNLMR
jgi:hypothetical protein